MTLNTSAIYQFVLILFVAILLIGFFAPMLNVSLAQTAIDTPVANSTRSNYLTYEDTTRGIQNEVSL